MAKIRYPTGVTPMQNRPEMKNYQVKPVYTQPNHVYYPKPRKRKRRNKFYAQKFFMFNIWFDSKSEARYCCLLKAKQIPFSYHHRYMLHPRVRYRYQGHTVKLIKRTYTPDFILWRPGQKHNWRHPWKVIDIKGKKRVTVGANRQMDDFSRKYRKPVIISRFDYDASKQSGLLVFNEQIKGTHYKYQVTAPPYLGGAFA